MKAQANAVATLALVVSIIALLSAAIIGIDLLLRVHSTILVIAGMTLLAAQAFLMLFIWQIWRTASTASKVHTASSTVSETPQEQIGLGLEPSSRQTHQQQINDARLGTVATPVIPITNGIVIIPFVGTIDIAHIQVVRANLLDGIAKYQAKVAIVDLTGINELPTETVQSFVKILSAADLMGCRIVLTGISANTARPLLEQQLDLPAKTCRNLQAGIAYATKLLSATSTKHISFM